MAAVVNLLRGQVVLASKSAGDKFRYSIGSALVVGVTLKDRLSGRKVIFAALTVEVRLIFFLLCSLLVVVIWSLGYIFTQVLAERRM